MDISRIKIPMADFPTHSIVQGSGIGPTLWLIMKSDLHPLSDAINVIFKYADDTNLLVPENADCTLIDKFSHIKRWADTNGPIINFDKTKELVQPLGQPSPNSVNCTELGELLCCHNHPNAVQCEMNRGGYCVVNWVRLAAVCHRNFSC